MKASVWTVVVMAIFGLPMILLDVDAFAAGSDVTDYEEMARVSEALNRKGRHQEVIDLLLPLAEQEGNRNSSFFNELGLAYGKIGSKTTDLSYWEKAYVYHTKAYSLDRSEPEYIFNLAMAASWLDKRDEALGLFKKYVATGHQRRRALAVDAVRKLEALK